MVKEDMVKKEDELKGADEQIGVLKKSLQATNKAPISYKRFLELFGNLPILLRKSQVLQEKDKIIRKIFLNFTLENWKVASYQLNSPFKELTNA